MSMLNGLFNIELCSQLYFVFNFETQTSFFARCFKTNMNVDECKLYDEWILLYLSYYLRFTIYQKG